MEEPKVPKISVIIRKRPLHKKEQIEGALDIVEIPNENSATCIVREMKERVDLTRYIEEHRFTLDNCFGGECNNLDIYNRQIKPQVSCAFQKVKVTCFAYGQTGSGKTHTMMGNSSDTGLYLLAARDIFQNLKEYPMLGVGVSFYEIYCGKVYDLLTEKKQLFVREDAKQNVNIVGLSEYNIYAEDELLEVIKEGNKNRVVGVTGANMDSSRSHAILQINLINTKTGKLHGGKQSFIDLAGNERGADSNMSDKQTQRDGAEINKSLLALKECIRALDMDKNHTPFRGSKLTLVLKDSFVGNCKTIMIGNITPTTNCCEHTLNTLRYADRVKEQRKDPVRRNAPGAGGGTKDALANQLMLPRQQGNSKKFDLAGKQLGRTSVDFKKQKSNNSVPGKEVVKPSTAASGTGQGRMGVGKPQNMSGNRSKSRAKLATKNTFSNTGTMQNNFLKPITNNSSGYGLNAIAVEEPSLSKEYGGYSNKFSRNFMNKSPERTKFDKYRSPKKPDQLQSKMQRSPEPNPPPKQPYQGNSNSNYNFTKGQGPNFQDNSRSGQKLFNVNNYMGGNGNEQFAGSTAKSKASPNRKISNENLLDNNDVQYMDDQSPDDGYYENLPIDEQNNMHEKLINKILAEEEEIINSHRMHIDTMFDFSKKEVSMLEEVDKPGSEIDSYVESLEQVQSEKLDEIDTIRRNLNLFRENLKQEQQLSRICNSKFQTVPGEPALRGLDSPAPAVQNDMAGNLQFEQNSTEIPSTKMTNGDYHEESSPIQLNLHGITPIPQDQQKCDCISNVYSPQRAPAHTKPSPIITDF